MTKLVIRVEISHHQIWDVDPEALKAAFPQEWKDAQEQGLSVEQFVRQAADHGDLEWLDGFTLMDESNNIDVWPRLMDVSKKSR